MSVEATCRIEELERDVLAVALRPELNEVPWTDIERTGSGIVHRIESRPRPRVLIDLTELNHMGSAIVALVVRIWKTVSEREGRMVVVNHSAIVAEVLEISGLAGKWTIVADRRQAIEAVGGADRSADGSLRGNAAGGVALTAASAVLAALAVAGLADAAFGGLASRAIGPGAFLGICTGCAVAALVLALIAVAWTAGRLRGGAAALAAVSLAAVVIGIVLLASRPEPEPATRAASRTARFNASPAALSGDRLTAIRLVRRPDPA